MAETAGPGSLHRPHWTDVAHSSRRNSQVPAIVSIRLVICSPVRLVREGLAASLHGHDGVEVMDAVSLDAEGIARMVAAAPDVVLVDLGQTDAVAAARLVRDARPEAKLVAFALDERDTDVFACAAAGFCSYVARESGAEELLRALVDAMGGRMHCAPHIAAAMFRRLADLLRTARSAGFAARAHVARERDPGAGRSRPLQQGNRTGSRDQLRHGQESHAQHLAEAASDVARTSRRAPAARDVTRRIG
jgi:DNA-binding NarL/FixJ family response regulator